MGVPEATVGGELAPWDGIAHRNMAGVMSTWFLRTESLRPGGLGDTPAAQLSSASVCPVQGPAVRQEGAVSLG